MIDHLKHMMTIRPEGPDQDAAQLALDEIDRLRERCEAYKGQVEAGAIEIERLLRGIKCIQECLEANPPRIGDATFDCEALLAGSVLEQKPAT